MYIQLVPNETLDSKRATLNSFFIIKNPYLLSTMEIWSH